LNLTIFTKIPMPQSLEIFFKKLNKIKGVRGWEFSSDLMENPNGG
jgi:hypothetical protein